MIRKLKYVAIPVGLASGLTLIRSPVAHAAEGSSKDSAVKLQKTPWDVYCEPSRTASKSPKQCDMESGIQKAVKTCREEITPVKDSVNEFYENVKESTGKVTGVVMEQVKYLQTEASEEIKVGTIAGAFVLGYLLSIRRRFLRKFFNGTVLAAATAAVIFPKDSKCIAKNGYVLARSAVLDAYSSVSGAAQTSKSSESPTPKKKRKCDDN